MGRGPGTCGSSARPFVDRRLAHRRRVGTLWFLVGLEQGLMGLVLEPELAEAMLERLAD
jgi:hypothetical protein